jgi:hypothetical protein
LKVKKPVDLRMEMMVRLSQGERLTDLGREYGISRKTGEKYYSTYDDVLRVGPQGLVHMPGRRQVHLTKARAGHLIGISEEG